jgi:hypothetical protein
VVNNHFFSFRFLQSLLWIPNNKQEGKSMKKVIVVLVALAIAAIGCAFDVAELMRTYRIGQIYTREVEFENGFAKGFQWTDSGERMIYTIEELKDLAEDCRVSIQGWGSNGVTMGFTLTEDTALVVSGLSLDDGISETYYLTF